MAYCIISTLIASLLLLIDVANWLFVCLKLSFSSLLDSKFSKYGYTFPPGTGISFMIMRFRVPASCAVIISGKMNSYYI